MARRRYSGWGGWDSGYYRQPRKAELQERAARVVDELIAAGQAPQPVALTGTRIATTWWGKAWVENLDRYADLAYRVDRGKSYLRANCVVDLKVSRGKIRALVAGSRGEPYQVSIDIEPLEEESFAELMGQAGALAPSLEALVAGDFPESLKAQLHSGSGGLFPAKEEIGFECTCPDWANLCKHVAAVLLAIAPRLDSDPLELFELRGVDTGAAIRRSVAETIDLMVANADASSDRILDLTDDELTGLFGVL